MASIYDDLEALASELLTADDDNFGQSTSTHPITILYRSDVAGSTALDEPTVTWTPSATLKAVSRGVSEKRDGAALIAKADKVFTIYATGVTAPTNADKIDVDGVEYSIVSVEPLPNGETVSVYKVYGKR